MSELSVVYIIDKCSIVFSVLILLEQTLLLSTLPEIVVFQFYLKMNPAMKSEDKSISELKCHQL
jgi:hypothetical protein